jgi:hypothetical protein
MLAASGKGGKNIGSTTVAVGRGFYSLFALSYGATARVLPRFAEIFSATD